MSDDNLVQLTLDLPTLPKKYIWVQDSAFVSNTNLVKLTIYRKFGWLHKRVVEGEWFELSADNEPDKMVDNLNMQCEILMFQLPEKIIVGSSDK